MRVKIIVGRRNSTSKAPVVGTSMAWVEYDDEKESGMR